MYKIKGENNLLSNELIFPLLSFIEVNSLILYGSVCINKFAVENSVFEGPLNDNNNKGIRLNSNSNIIGYKSNLIRYISGKDNSKQYYSENNVNKSTLKLNKYSSSNNHKQNGHIPYTLSKPGITNNNISNIPIDASIHSLNINKNVNEDISSDNYNKSDLIKSVILQKISDRNLIKVIDDLIDQNENTSTKYKFLVISADELLPDLITIDKSFNYALLPEDKAANQIVFYKNLELFNIDQKNLKKTLSLEEISNLITEDPKAVKEIELHEDSLQGMRFKLFYKSTKSFIINDEKYNELSDYFVNIFSKYIKISIDLKDSLKSHNSLKKEKFLKYLVDNPKLQIKGNTLMMFAREYDIKLKYSLYKSNKIPLQITPEFIANIVLNTAKVLDTNFNNDNFVAYKNYFNRFGLNSCFDIFVLVKLKSAQAANILKLIILCKLIRKILIFHEGETLELYTYLNCLAINQSKNDYKVESNFSCINESNYQKTYFRKIYLIILSILDMKNCPKEFMVFFYEHLNFLLFLRLMKYHIINEFYILMKEFSKIFTVESLISEFMTSANKHPFLFLTVLEQVLNINIEPYIKFKASISRENFLEVFKCAHIFEAENIPKTYININEISFYLLTKCIYNSETIDNYRENLKTPIAFPKNDIAFMQSAQSKDTKLITSHEESKNEMNIAQIRNENDSIENIQNKSQKIQMITNLPERATNLSMNRVNNVNFPINSNNITKINNDNQKYFQEKKLDSNFNSSIVGKYSSTNIKKEQKEIDPHPKTKLILLDSFELQFPALLYKMKFREEDDKSYKKNINKFLSHKYIVNRTETLKDWRTQLEVLFNESYSISCSESIIIDVYLIDFFKSYFIDSDYNQCKELIFRIRECQRSFNFYKPDHLAMIFLLEGLISELKNYIESEEFFSKSIITSLLLFGDPRGRGCSGKIYLLYPLWKICRQTCILENNIIHENFKEFFYAQDNVLKNLIDCSSINNLYYEYLLGKYNFDATLKNPRDLKILKLPNKAIISKKSLDLNEINILLDENNENEINNEIEREYTELSDENYEVMKQKYFLFPPISDFKTSYKGYFTSQNFISFLIKSLPLFSFLNRNWTDETLLSLNLNNTGGGKDLLSQSDISLIHHSSQKSFNTIKKANEKLFSAYLYENLLEKLDYKSSPPNGTVLTWGLNLHNETSHDNYEKLYLPRTCFKLKDEEIVSISCGWEYNISLTDEGTLYSWGNNESGQCGLNTTLKIILSPTIIDGLNNVKMVSCGNEHSLALLNNGEVYSWGKGNGGVLGFNFEDNSLFPRKIEGFLFELICSGSLHNIAIGKDGNLYSWGCGEGGQLGHNEETLVINYLN